MRGRPAATAVLCRESGRPRIAIRSTSRFPTERSREPTRVVGLDGFGELGVVAVAAVFRPAGTAPCSGGYYRVVDTGIRCIRAPCFSFRATQVNGSTRMTMSAVDLERARADAGRGGAGAGSAATRRAGSSREGASRSTPDGGRVFRALAPLSSERRSLAPEHVPRERARRPRSCGSCRPRDAAGTARRTACARGRPRPSRSPAPGAARCPRPSRPAGSTRARSAAARSPPSPARRAPSPRRARRGGGARGSAPAGPTRP